MSLQLLSVNYFICLGVLLFFGFSLNNNFDFKHFKDSCSTNCSFLFDSCSLFATSCANRLIKIKSKRRKITDEILPFPLMHYHIDFLNLKRYIRLVKNVNYLLLVIFLKNRFSKKNQKHNFFVYRKVIRV